MESLELETKPALKTLLDDRGGELDEETFSERYADMFAKRFDAYCAPSKRGNRNHLLGDPTPEQSDPRYCAVIGAEFGKSHLTSEECASRRDEIEAKARDWRLLLQIDVADRMQDDVEGSVYFLIRRHDLKEGRFDRVVAVYQQT